MQEKIVRQVMIKYFASKGIKVRPSRGAGPDLLIDGKAVEVKGSRYNFDSMLRQLVDYAYKYSDVALALPFNGLTLKKANQLAALYNMIKEARNIRLKVYVVIPDSTNHNLFYVREFEEAWQAASTIGSFPSIWKLGFKLEAPDSTIHEAIKNLIKYSPTNEFRDYILSLDYRVSKVQI